MINGLRVTTIIILYHEITDLKSIVAIGNDVVGDKLQI